MRWVPDSSFIKGIADRLNKKTKKKKPRSLFASIHNTNSLTERRRSNHCKSTNDS
jgi:hypothetical protein